MFSTLNIGASALYATQRAVEVASQNVANATVDGYSRQRVEMTTAVPSPGTLGARSDGMRGNGVVVTDITRLHDQLADVAVRSELTANGYAGARSTTLDRAQSVLGPVWTGAPAKLDALFASFNDLANNPTDPAARDAVLSAGQAVSQSLNDASKQLTDITNDAASKVGGDVDRVNQLSSQVADLNQSILDARASGQAPNDLLDSRDRAVDELHTLAGVSIHQNSSGSIDVYAGTKPLVRDNESFALKAGAASGTGVPTVAFADGSSASVGGEIGGYIAVTTVDLPGLRASLDAVANGLATAVNAQHQAGTGLDGSTGNAFFTGTTAASLAVSPTLTSAKIAASAGGTANDGNNALALFRVSTNTGAVTLPGSAPASIGDALRSLGGRLGALAAGAASVAQTTSTAVDSATKTRSSLNGVSVDEEMVDLVKYQHAYSAAAKVVSTADAMLDTLINHLGA